ncbi:MAG: hypothetical protein COB85_09170 [Bacteroidetes bacterium]|nr:MAG: hypothetical protein COB85_09170 [Bacteroidota bacterium]
MKLQFTLLIITFFFPYLGNSQNNFEILVPWGTDTSVGARYSEELPDGGFMVLGGSADYYPGPGILIEGPNPHGAALLKLSETGTVLWKNTYETNHLPGLGGQMESRWAESGSYFSRVQEKIIIPFSKYVNWVICDSIPFLTLMATYKTGIAIIDSATGNEVIQQLYWGDSLCSKTYYSGFAAINDSATACVETYDSAHFIIRDMSGSIISKALIDARYRLGNNTSKMFAYNPTDTSFTAFAVDTVLGGRRLIRIHPNGNVDGLVPLSGNGSMPFVSFIVFNQRYYVLYHEYDSINGGFLKSHLFKYAENGDVLQQLTFNDSKPADLEINPESKIIMACDISKGDNEDSISQPVRVFLLDTNLNILSYKDFGFPYAQPSHITTTSNNGFLVTGTLLKAYLDTSIREPNQVYVLKSSIDSINNNWVVIPNPGRGDVITKIYPNPNTGQFTIKTYMQEPSKLSISIYHFTGQLIYSKDVGNITDSYTLRLDLSRFSKGIYYVQIVTKKGVAINKVIYQ